MRDWCRNCSVDSPPCEGCSAAILLLIVSRRALLFSRHASLRRTALVREPENSFSLLASFWPGKWGRHAEIGFIPSNLFAFRIRNKSDDRFVVCLANQF